MVEYPAIPEEVEALAKEIVDAAYKIHSALGPGLMENVYGACFAHELEKRGIPYLTELTLPVRYDGVDLDTGYRLDFLVNHLVIVELKAVEKMIPLFDAQIITYLKLTGVRVGFLINFNVPLIKDGIKRIAH
jgi:GxxExxY protein